LLGDVAGRSQRQILFWVRYDHDLSALAEFVVRSRDLHQFKAFRDQALDELLAVSFHTQIFAQFHFSSRALSQPLRRIFRAKTGVPLERLCYTATATA
jgi:hypothetical protein